MVEGRFGASQLMSWARLLKRVFQLNLEHCPNCGGELKIIAAIREQPVIDKILTHLGLLARVPRRAAGAASGLTINDRSPFRRPEA